jgi:hypothetical protein
MHWCKVDAGVTRDVKLQTLLCHETLAAFGGVQRASLAALLIPPYHHAFSVFLQNKKTASERLGLGRRIQKWTLEPFMVLFSLH